MATSSIGVVVKFDDSMAAKIIDVMKRPTKWVKCENSHMDLNPNLSKLKNLKSDSAE